MALQSLYVDTTNRQTESGLTPTLDAITAAIGSAARNRDQLRGLAPALASTGIPVNAPGQSILSRLIGVSADGTPAGPATPPAMGESGVSPAAAPVTMAPAVAGMPDANQIASYIGQAAQARGIDPMTAIRVAQSEGGLAPNRMGDGNSSTGPFQLHYGGVAAGGNSAAGLGDDFTKATGKDARDPANWQAAVDFALDNAAKSGWGAFHGAAKAGIGQFDGIQQPQQAAAYAPSNQNAASSPAGRAIAAAAPQQGAGPAPGPMPQATADQAIPQPQNPYGGLDGARAALGSPQASPPPASAPQQVAQLGPPPQMQQAGLGAAPPQPQGAVGTQLPPPPARGAPPMMGQQGMAAPNPLPGGLTPAAIGAMIQNPATREMGLQLWQNMLTPRPGFKLAPGEAQFDVRGREIAALPNAPVKVDPGAALVDPRTGQPMFRAPPNLEHTETGTDAYGQKQYGSFNPQTGAAAPFAGAPGVVPGGTAPAAADGSSAHGQAFLATLPDVLAGQVQAIAEGRMKMPPAGSRSPMAVRLASMVSQYDPGFDQANAEARFGTRESWAHGPVSQTLTAGNTAIQHLGDLSDAAEALSNGNSPTWNRIGQEYGNLTGGNVAGKQFANTLNDFTGELVKFYRGTGGSEHDIEAAKEALDPSQSPAQLRAGIAQQAKLISGKVNALQGQWHQSMGPQAPDYPIIQPESQAALDRIQQRFALTAPGAQQPSAAAAPGQRLTPEQAKALPAGTPFVGTDGISRVRH